MDVLTVIVVSSVSFGRTVIGLVFRPYETYRRIVSHGRFGELALVAFLIVVYFAFSGITRVIAVFGSYCITLASFWLAGRIVRVKFHLGTLAIAWGYTLIPTLVWFLMTSLLYVILPPPRTTTALGISFSVVFLMFSATLLWWKMMLSYLTIRFVFKIDLPRIALMCTIVIPIVTAYSALLYYLGIFKVPFL